MYIEIPQPQDNVLTRNVSQERILKLKTKIK